MGDRSVNDPILHAESVVFEVVELSPFTVQDAVNYTVGRFLWVPEQF